MRIPYVYLFLSQVAARVPPPSAPPSHLLLAGQPSWAVMAQEDELVTAAAAEEAAAAAAAEEAAAAAAAHDDGEEEKETDGAGRPRARLTREQREMHRFRNMLRKDDFICFERIKGHLINILTSLELHADMFSTTEQKRIVDRVYGLQETGKRGELAAS